MLSVYNDCCRRVACDALAIAALVAILVPVIVVNNAGRVVQRGFFCDDESIRLPSKDETVPTWALFLASLGLPTLTMILGNFYERRRPSSFHTFKGVPPWLTHLGFQFRWFVIGFLITEVVTQIGKVVVGRLRPDFIDICNPDFSTINCTDAYDHPTYVITYECRGNRTDVIRARVSWPSEHSSVSAYAFVFIAVYLASVRTFFYPHSGLKILLMCISLLLSLLIGLSRISDNRHHPSDVLSGFVLGGLVAVGIMFFNIYSRFSRHEPDRTFSHHQSDSSAFVQGGFRRNYDSNSRSRSAIYRSETPPARLIELSTDDEKSPGEDIDI